MITADTKTTRITQFSDLHTALAHYRTNAAWMFRGHADVSWELSPKAGRPPFSEGTRDLSALEAWKRQARGFIKESPQNDWEWLAVAQHHGLATRLLDWTYHPLTAAWFAVSEPGDDEAVVYAYLTTYHWVWEKYTPKDAGVGIGRYLPPAIAPRIARQGGVFTMHSPPDRALETHLNPNDKLEALVIDGSYRNTLRQELSHYGVNALTLFPDLDGLSSHVNWLWRERMYSNRALLVPEEEALSERGLESDSAEDMGENPTAGPSTEE